MKRFLIFGAVCIAAITLLAVPASVRADGRPISATELPAEAQKMLHTYFNSDPVTFALYDSEWDDAGYEVRLESGAQIDFSKGGNWQQVDCSPAAVPEGLIPSAIRAELERTHPNHSVVKIERDRRGYEIELSGGVELEFNSAGKLVGWDD